MRPAQEIMAELAASGLAPEQIALVIELSAAVATEARPVVDAAAERRRSKDRAYQATRRQNRQKSADSADIPPEVSPKNNIQTPSSPPAQVSEPNGSSPSPRAWALPVGVSLQIWTDFLGNRKRKRLGNTETAWKSFNDDLRRVSTQTGIPPPRLIEIAAGKGWGSINDPNERTSHHERPDNPTALAVQRLTGSLGAHH